MKLSAVEIRLLVVFDAIVQEHSLTKAAHRVGLSQPAVSSALKKLRHLLKDELFVRVPGGVVPTPRAQELAAPIHNVLLQLETALDPVTFKPETARNTFRIASSDLCTALILPRLHDRLRAHAPGIHLRVRPKLDPLYVSQLDAGEIHFALGTMRDPPKRVSHVVLFHDDHVCVMHESHPLAGKPLTLDRYLASNHMILTHFGEASHVLDDVLAQQGLKRNVTLTVHQPHLAPLLLKGTDVIMTTFSRLVPSISGHEGLHMVPLPFELPPLAFRLAWSSVCESQPAHLWMRQQILDACAHLG